MSKELQLKSLTTNKELNKLNDVYQVIIELDKPANVYQIRLYMTSHGWKDVPIKYLRSALTKLTESTLIQFDENTGKYSLPSHLEPEMKYVIRSNLKISPFTAGILYLSKKGKLEEFKKEHRGLRYQITKHLSLLERLGALKVMDGSVIYLGDKMINKDLPNSALFSPISTVKNYLKRIKKTTETKKHHESLADYWKKFSTKDIVKLNRMMLGQISNPLE